LKLKSTSFIHTHVPEVIILTRSQTK